MTTRYEGANWLKRSLRLSLSALGETVADMLGDTFGGIYHLDADTLKKIDWEDDYVLVVPLYRRSLSTFDDELLTKLVVLAHDRCLRLSISAVADVEPGLMRRAVDEEWSDKEIEECGRATLELMFHRRQRSGDVSRRMPTMESHLAAIRKYYPAPEVSGQEYVQDPMLHEYSIVGSGGR